MDSRSSASKSMHKAFIIQVDNSPSPMPSRITPPKAMLIDVDIASSSTPSRITPPKAMIIDADVASSSSPTPIRSPKIKYIGQPKDTTQRRMRSSASKIAVKERTSGQLIIHGIMNSKTKHIEKERVKAIKLEKEKAAMERERVEKAKRIEDEMNNARMKRNELVKKKKKMPKFTHIGNVVKMIKKLGQKKQKQS